MWELGFIYVFCFREEPSPAVLAGIQFILENFGEMTRLWVRMQHQVII